MTGASASAVEKIIFAAGISNQNPGGGIELQSNYSYNIGGGLELTDDLFALIKFTLPSIYTGETYPALVTINDVNDTLNFREFTLYDLEIVGHYILPLFEGSKVNPKFFGGLGMHWLYNSNQKAGEPDVQFNGIGPEFGLGAVYRPRDNLLLDFTASVKFPYYNEYKVQSQDALAVGVDEQVLCFNFAFLYLIPID